MEREEYKMDTIILYIIIIIVGTLVILWSAR